MHQNKPTLTLDLSDDEKFRLRLIAEQNGLLIGRGIMSDMGSIQKLVSGIANGTFRVVPIENNIVTITSSDTSNTNIIFTPDIAGTK